LAVTSDLTIRSSRGDYSVSVGPGGFARLLERDDVMIFDAALIGMAGKTRRTVLTVTADEEAKTLSSSGKTYVVKKGDNPVAIAKKLKVSYSDLMALNHLDDPRKLQIGQKLLIPKPATIPKKTETKKSKK